MRPMNQPGPPAHGGVEDGGSGGAGGRGKELVAHTSSVSVKRKPHVSCDHQATHLKGAPCQLGEVVESALFAPE
jgi:hypothetical protein